MARKKKTKKIETATAPILNTEVSGTQDISYTGTVQIKVQHGKKTIRSKKYHNNGMPDLFKFLCLALAGSYTEALRPCKIKLFCYEEAFKADASPVNFDWKTVFSKDETKPTDASPFIVYDTTPVVKSVSKDGKTVGYETTFHFRIPGSLISNDVIHMIGLYANNIYIDREDQASAYYLLTDRDSDKNLIWDPIELGADKVSGNYSLIIDWTMSVKNKEVVTNTTSQTN